MESGEAGTVLQLLVRLARSVFFPGGTLETPTAMTPVVPVTLKTHVTGPPATMISYTQNL